MWENIREFRVENRVDSDHAPVCAFLGGLYPEEIGAEETGKRRRKEAVEKQIITWGEEEVAAFKAATDELDGAEREEDTSEDRWASIKKIVEESIKRKTVKFRIWKIGMKTWWNKSCAMKKKGSKKGSKRLEERKTA